MLDAQNVEKGFSTFAAFTTKFHAMFESLSPATICISNMKVLKQTRQAEDYVATFCPLTMHSTVIEVTSCLTASLLGSPMG